MSYATLARFYDALHAALTDDVPFVTAQAVAVGGHVLELGCGTGRLVGPLVAAGCTVTGVDNSAEMLAIARRRLAPVSDRCTLHQGDMTRLDLPNATFDLALLSYNTALHLSPAHCRAMLRSVDRVIRPNGRLLIDTINPVLLAEWPDQLTPVVDATFVEPESGATVTQWSTNRAVPGEQAVEVVWRFDVGDEGDSAEQITSRVTYHYQYAHEWQLMLANTGWRMQNAWGEYDQTPYHEGASRLILVATRQSR